jgi:hypothetical protein
MSVTQVHELAKIVAELHHCGAEIPIPTQAIKEDFSIPFCKKIKA